MLGQIPGLQRDTTEIIRAEDDLEAAVLRAREKYTEFNARWPAMEIGGGRSFKERFTYQGSISLWWLTGASMKQNEVSDTFDYLCHLEVFSKVLSEGRFHRCMAVSGDQTFSFLVQSRCQSLGVSFSGEPSEPGVRLPSLVRAAVHRTGFLFWQMGLAAILGLMFRGRSKQHRGTANYLGFLTTYPEILGSQDGRPSDRIYRSLPQALAANGMNISLVASIYGPPLAILGRLKEIWQLRRSTGPDFWPLQSLGRPSDSVTAWGQWSTFWRYLRIERQLRGLLKYDGVDISPLVLRDLRRSFLGNEIVHNLLVLRLLERWARNTAPRGLLCSLELYSFARAAYFGVKKGSPASWTIAMQHANITAAKLWYSYLPEEMAVDGSDHVASMPVPDRYIFQGDGGRQLVSDSGYPSEQSVVLGSPRYDELRKSSESPVRTEGGPWQVLVVPSLSRNDEEDMLDTVATACSGNAGDYRVLVKPHPACPVDDFLDAVRSRHQSLDIEIAPGDLYTLIKQSDLIVTSYSTAGDEAIVMGRPVIAYTGLRPSMSTYMDIPAAPLVHTVEQLREAIERMLTDPKYQEQFLRHRSDLVRWTFHELDGGATGRITDYLTQLLSGVPESA